MAPAVEPLLQSLFPADVFVATVDNRDHAFAPAVSDATSYGQVLPAGHQGLTTSCEVCGAALGAHALAVRWKRDARVLAGHSKQRKRSHDDNDDADANNKTPPVAPTVAQHPLYGIVMTQDHQAETDFFRLWLARMHEQLRRGKNLANFDSVLKERRRVPKEEWAGRGRPPLQTLSAQTWFDLMRNWPAHIYAYAVPTRGALKEIVNLGSIVEVGAGTGYWAYHLRTMGANVVAADIAPLEMDTSTSAGSNGKKRNNRGGAHTRANEYHGQLPAYTRIEAMPRGRKGGSLDASWAQRDALFLCYPPPGTPMAENALADFQGQHVAVVGEWIGTTATQPFEVSLQREFILSKTVHLPNWPNTAYTLTIWRRRDKAIAAPQPVPMQALTCEVCASALGQGAELRRCALTRSKFCRLLN
ncbi:Hypothetical Protein FCC1311_024722 [Hondaea fermentalgiana]|uniref:Uncharacterized protein n=1 Tax=Hondaea fermentalgiana TaxID=2315210 RepID=A0A2R5GDI3_9STRA|nr:Hypothetical Protein FCC1311_024722 [Hondaea fermentalgiana]|eukprot:GBG26251.1 Hypothetical Protein FCC1311_024722 [Hondaea fermentalgiana]